MSGRLVYVLVELLAVLGVALAQKKEVYFTLNGSLVLEPNEGHGAITSITWKSKGDIVTEFIKDAVPVDDFGDFKDRTRLDLITGVVKIKPTRPTDAGEFTVEINNVVQAGVYQAVILEKVPKPDVVLRPLTCSQSSPSCSVSCDGQVERPDLVSYFWKIGNGDWEKSGKEMNITNDEKSKTAELLSCKMQNPVSEEESAPHNNPFYQPPPPTPTGLIVGILILVLVAGGVAGVAVAHKKGKLSIPGLGRGDRAAEASPANGSKNIPESHPLNADNPNTNPSS